ncbi:hypothetical protein GGS26DRAFT_594846 [Hypomontagnella submonticulosa]|nr:hypothetical protein GGS26DRAFT_594846 [Hypomontagnella submonticulosa]
MGYSTIFLIAALIGLWVSDVTKAATIPAPTGPYQVGVRKFTIEHYNDHDPVAPNNRSTAFLATIFYPTHQKAQAPPEPYLNPETAAIFERSWNYSAGTLESLTSTVQKDARFLESEHVDGEQVNIPMGLPVILFGPGAGGPPVEGNTILLSELASHGYAVIGLDHPFEQPFIRYPNGTGVEGIVIDYSSNDLITAIYNMRLEDNAAFLDYHLAKLVDKYNLPLDMKVIGALGYSLGGAAGLGSLQRTGRLVSGLNLDGTLFGDPALNSTTADIRKPVFLLGNEGHGGEYYGDVSWATFPRWQTGYQRKMLVNGTTHHDFCDDTFWKTLEAGADPGAGPIDGLEQVRVLNAYVKAFFDFTLLGRHSPIIDGPSPEFPEVVFLDPVT